MFGRLKRGFFSSIVLIWAFTPFFVQGEEINVFEETKTDAYIIVGSVAAGAVLGLSTLSFSSDASEDLDHVVVGSALGIIAGVAVVAWRQAKKGRNFYEGGDMRDEYSAEFSTKERLAWHQSRRRKLVNGRRPAGLAYSFSF